MTATSFRRGLYRQLGGLTDHAGRIRLDVRKRALIDVAVRVWQAERDSKPGTREAREWSSLLMRTLDSLARRPRRTP